MTKFKPCPFCGGRAEHSIGKTSGGKPWHYVECVDCGATAPVPPWADHNIAVIERLAKAWNTRAEILADAMKSSVSCANLKGQTDE